jgi:RNA polymerase sigma-70 factor (ECF subfamily)
VDFDEIEKNLSQISTQWNVVFQAHAGTPDQVSSATARLMCRYAGAVHRYLLKVARDPEEAAELDQEFAVRFLKGDFRKCDPKRGRFRDYVKRALQNLIVEYYRQRKRKPPPDFGIGENALAENAPAKFEQQFIESWRKDLLERAWCELSELEKSTGRPYHTVLRARVDHPDLHSNELAERLSSALGRPLTAGAVRQALQRSRRKYVDYLVTEVLASLERPTREELEEELSDLSLLDYFRPFLNLGFDTLRDTPAAAKSIGPSEFGITSKAGLEQESGATMVPECPPNAVGPVEGPRGAETSPLDQVSGASQRAGRPSAAAEALAESASVGDFVLAFVESAQNDPGIALSKIEAGIQQIDAALGITVDAAELHALKEARERLQALQEILATCEESVSLSSTLDQILIDDNVRRERLRSEANRIRVLGQPVIAPTQPATIRRHTDVSFPTEVEAGKVYNLRVQLVPASSVLPSGEVCERPKPHVHDATLDLTVPAPATPDAARPPVSLVVSLAAENFEVEGLARAEIIVPFEGKSSAVQFSLRGLEIGPGRIMLDFAQNGRPTGSVDLAPVVVGSAEALRPVPGLAPTSVEYNLDLYTDQTPTSPDVVLKVFEHRQSGHPGRLQFVLSSSHPALADLPVLDGDLGTLDLRTDVAGWVGEQLRVVGTLAGEDDASAGGGGRTLASVGFNLFEHLLPPAVQEISWTFRQRGVKTVMVLSDDPHIPWELVKPFRADPATGAIISEDGFWGESYALAHWLRGRPPMPRLKISRVMGVAAAFDELKPTPISRPDFTPLEFRAASTRDITVRINTTSTDTGVAPGSADQQTGHTMPETPTEPAGVDVDVAALDPVITTEGSRRLPQSSAVFDEELGLLRALESLGARVERLPALRRAVRQAFEDGSFDLLHLISHGSFGGSDAADATAVYLDDGMFTAAELSPLMAGALRRAAPLVIFNTCHCGRMGFSLTRLGSWGAHLVRLGCGAFIGALWPVSDRAALAFARAFYDQLTSRRPLGEAVRLARLRVREQFPGDPTWLAYCCFADPTARFEPGQRRENPASPSDPPKHEAIR